MRMSVENAQERVALIMGEAGTGKTTLAKRIANSAFDGSPISMKSVLATEGISSPNRFVRKITDYLGIPPQRSLEKSLEHLNSFVVNNSQTGSGLFLVIDADLKSATVNTLLDILLWKDTQGFPLAVRAIVFSQNNIFRYAETKPALNEIVGIRQTLGNLSFASASSLIENRVRMAGRSAPLFQPDALSEIVERTKGHPGDLIDLANRSFTNLLESNEDSISLRTVLEAQDLI